MRAYHSSASTLNLLRAFATGGFADLHQVHAWNRDFVAASPAGARYDALGRDIDRALSFMRAIGVTLGPSGEQVELYTSHEALLLEYERALTRTEDATGLSYDLSAHTIWIGERTRDLEGAHVAFAAAVGNPIGVKLGPTASPEDAAALVERLDPRGEPGRVTLIARMGAAKVADRAAAADREGARDRPRCRLGLRSDARQHRHARAGSRPAGSTTSWPRCRASSTSAAASASGPAACTSS